MSDYVDYDPNIDTIDGESIFVDSGAPMTGGGLPAVSGTDQAGYVVGLDAAKNPDWFALASILTFDTIKVTGVTNIGTAYQQIGRLTTPVRPVGSYLFGISITYHFPTALQSVFLRYQFNGGPWNEYVFEQSDATNVNPFVYGFPKEMPAPTAFDVIVEMRKEGGTEILNVDYLDLWVNRVA